MRIYWPSPAKINLFLYITGQRKDGYHTLQTLIQFLNYGDTISIVPRHDGRICLLTPLKNITNKSNLIIRSANLLMYEAIKSHRISKNSGVNIAIKKRLPIGGGLGGGSSNAATILVALNQLWGCNFSEIELATLGLKLGADVPVFIHGYASFAEGIGEQLYPISLPEQWYLIVYPRLSISTKLIFHDPELFCNTPKQSVNKLLHSNFSNDCEIIARKRFDKVNAALSWLLQYAPSRLTGTGSCIVAEFETKESARKVLEKTPTWLHSFIAQGVNVSPLKTAISYHEIK